jgi:hypothetical protein
MTDKKREEEDMDNLVSEFVKESLKKPKTSKNAIIGLLEKNKKLLFAFLIVVFLIIQGAIKTTHDFILLLQYIF